MEVVWGETYFPVEFVINYLINADKNIKKSMIELLSEISVGKLLTPMIEIKSHKKVLKLILLMKKLKLPDKYFVQSFNNWTKDFDWIKLKKSEYLYLLYKEYPELVDYEKYFREHEDPFESFKSALELEVIKNNSELRLSMIRFYEQFKIKNIFEENNEETKKKYEVLWGEKMATSENFLINPFDYKDYLKYVKSTELNWSNDKIYTGKRYREGETVICTEEEFWKRFDDFTCKIFDELSDEVKSRLIVAGGSINLILNKDYVNNPASDIDIYVPKGKVDGLELFDKLINEFDKKYQGKIFYAIRGCVMNVYIKGINRTIQIISDYDTNVYGLLRKYDMTHIQLAVRFNKKRRELIGTPLALLALRERLARFGWIGNLKLTRLIKAMYRGYDLHQDERIIKKYESLVNYIVNNDDNIKKIIREFHAYFHPKNEDDNEYILGMIERHVEASLVTTDINVVLNNIIIGGKFRTDYEAMSYTNFNKKFIVVKDIPRRWLHRINVKRDQGTYRLMSGKMIVKLFILNEHGLEISAEICELEFMEFINKLETEVFKMYKEGDVTKKMMNDDHRIKIKVKEYVINGQEQRKFALLRNQRGEGLNIKEDLAEGDEIKIIFYVNILYPYFTILYQYFASRQPY